jgi:TonB family protein
MNSFLLYSIKSILGLGIFYFTWFLFFRKQTDFRFNRYYLIFTILLAIFIPFIQLPELFPASLQSPISQFSTVQLGEILIKNPISQGAAGIDISWATVLWGIYFLGVLVITIRFLLNLLQLYLLIRKSEIRREDQVIFVFPKGSLPVFSFFRFIFISKALYENPHAQAIIDHEKVHVRQKHSLDIMLLEIVSIFQWFNPFLFLLKRAIKENHEFIADSGMAVSESSGSGYLKLLFREASGFEFSPITHNFSYSLLKKRMIMMKNQKSQKKLTVKLLLTVLALSVTLFACNNSSQPTMKKAPKAVTVTKDKKIVSVDEMNSSQKKANAVQADTGQVFRIVEKMPQFPGGTKALLHYLSTNIKYPAEARKANIQGRVFIQFVVEKDGSISHVRVLKGIGQGCDKESVAVVKNMPRWIPGKQKGKPVRVEYNLPIKFSLN